MDIHLLVRDPDRLGRLRAAQRLSVRSLAAAAGCSKSMVSALEHGRRGRSIGCSAALAVGLAEALGVSVDKLFITTLER